MPHQTLLLGHGLSAFPIQVLSWVERHSAIIKAFFLAALLGEAVEERQAGF